MNNNIFSTNEKNIFHNKKSLFLNKNFVKNDCEKVTTCDLCNSTKFTIFLTTPDRNYKTGVFTYVKCLKCSLVYLNSRPKKSFFKKYYPDVYRPYHQYKKINSLQKLIRYFIRNNKFVAKALIKDQLFFWPFKGKILDVGPGSGYYLHVLKGWGWDVSGLELSKQAVKVAKDSGIKKIFKGDLHTVKFKPEYFDAVRYSHVLEHVPSPTKELASVKKILKKNGRIIIIIPNIDSIFFGLFKTFWYPLEAPRHFYQFTPKTISKLLKKQGFKNIKIKYIQPPHTFLWSLLYLLGLHDIDKKIGIFAYPLLIFLRIVNVLKKSDVIEVIAQK